MCRKLSASGDDDDPSGGGGLKPKKIPKDTKNPHSPVSSDDDDHGGLMDVTEVA